MFKHKIRLNTRFSSLSIFSPYFNVSKTRHPLVKAFKATKPKCQLITSSKHVRIFILLPTFQVPFYQTHANWEQDIIILKLLENTELAKRTLLLPHCLLQSFDPVWIPGHFIFHTPGLALRDKARLLEFVATKPSGQWAAVPRVRGPGSWRCGQRR